MHTPAQSVLRHSGDTPSFKSVFKEDRVHKSHWYQWATALLFAMMAAGSAFAAQKQIVRPSGTAAGGNFSPGILIEGTLYISGQAGEDKNGKIPAGFEAEVQQALDNVGVVLQKAGMTAKNIDGMKIGDRIDIT